MIHTGFIPDAPNPLHWKMGSGTARKVFGRTELMPGGHGWKDFLPKKEIQKRGKLETSACTIFGTANALETLANFYGYTDFPKDLAERYNAVLAKITPEGGSPHRSAETFRLFGGIPEHALPFSEDIRSWEYFYAPDPMVEEFITLGQNLLRKYRIGHEFVWHSADEFTPGKAIAALGRGTVCVSVSAWQERDGLYRKFGPDGHWLQLVDYKEGEYWLLYDSYEPTLKKYEWDAKFEQAKLFFMSPNPSKALPHEIDYLKWLLANGKFLEVMKWLSKNIGSWLSGGRS